MKWQKSGVIYCTVSCVLFLGVLGCLIVSCIFENSSGTTNLFEGRCSTADYINIAIHLGITIFAVAISISTDFFMRLVSAPQEDDVKRSHEQAVWLDIGINSLRNLSRIPKRRTTLWLLGLICSIPLQLVFHASVFSPATSTDYTQLLVSSGFVDGAPFALPGVALLGTTDGWRDSAANLKTLFEGIQNNVSAFDWDRLDSVKCRQTYLAASKGLQYYRNLVVVIQAGSDTNATGWTLNEIWTNKPPPFYNTTSTDEYPSDILNSLWSYSDSCYIGNNLGVEFNTCSGGLGYFQGLVVEELPSTALTGPWTFQWSQSQFGSDEFSQSFPNFNMDYNNITGLYCLAEPFITPCKVQVINPLLLVVCVCVLLKCIFSLTSLILFWKTKPIMSLGDAIQLFLRQEGDRTTRGLCTYSNKDFRSLSKQNNRTVSLEMQPKWNGQARTWYSPKRKWKSYVTFRTWAIIYAPLVCTLIFAVALFAIGENHNSYRDNVHPLAEAGFGDNPNNSKFNPVTGNLYRTSIVANLPQLVVSACFFTFSSFYSMLFQEREWSKFSVTSQRLKVTNPEEDQMSTYLLRIPLVWGLTFIIINSGLHWLVSQSFYATAIEVLPASSSDLLASPLQYFVGYSTEALLAVLVLAVVAILIPIGIALWPLPASNTVTVGTNSAAISAQCHQPIRYSRVRHNVVLMNDRDGVPETAHIAINRRKRSVEQDIEAAPLLQVPDGGASSRISIISGHSIGQADLSEVAESHEMDQAVGLLATERNDGRNVEPFDNDPDLQPWFGKLKWGVLQHGSVDRERPGHLGLGLPKQILGEPQNGHWYR